MKAAFFRIQLLRQHFILLVKGFRLCFALTTGFFQTEVESVGHFFPLLDFSLVNLVPLFVQVLDKRFVFGRDFCILRGQDALFFLQALVTAFPFVLLGRTLHNLFDADAGIFLGFLFRFLQVVGQNSQRLLKFFATLL